MAAAMAAAIFVPALMARGQRRRRVRPWCSGVVHAETARGPPILAPPQPYTRHHEPFPGDLGVAKQPRQGGQRIEAETRALEAGPADGLGHQESGATTCQPGALHGRQALSRVVVRDGGVERVDTGGPQGERGPAHPPCPQAVPGSERCWGEADVFQRT